ncbi:MAG: NAD(P)/FAD-dependent oxidoreductase [Ardenticatenaceae bacterium]
MKDLLIIGGGPGGVAAAAYGVHLGLSTLIISPDLGGKVNYRFSIKNFPYIETVYGSDLVRTFAAKIGPKGHLREEVSTISEIPGGFRVTVASGDTHEGRILIIATGAKPRLLYIPGEKELWGRGLSYSASSHAPLFVGKEVAVIGNDYRAQIAALELSRAAHTVYLIAPQPNALNPTLMERVNERGNVQLFKGWEVISIDGTDFVSGVSLQNKQGLIREIKLSGVFVELGLIPNSDFVSHLVERDEHGHIKVDQRTATSHPCIFAAGDVSNIHAEQVPIALGEGIKAALSASEYLASLSPQSSKQ